MAENPHLKEFARFMDIIARLRGPNGCPWDRKQTHGSLKEYLIQESYEVLEALDEEDIGKLRVELGDLMLQVLLHTQIAAENGEFEMKDVLHNINEKMIRRHPHVFADTSAATAEEVSHNWEIIKKAERKDEKKTESESSILDGVPRQMPSLAYSKEIQRRAAQVGFDWDDIDGVIDKLTEEIHELKEADSQQEKEEEFGDLFFTLVNIARRMGIDAESSLRQSNLKFYQRFSFMEKLCEERNLDFKKMSLDEMNELWEEAKRGISR